jgi:PAS domain-containing protein
MHHLTAPLLQFTRHVKAFTGREEEQRPFRVTSRDEIGTLAQAFNEMLTEMDKQKRTIREQKEFSENLLLNSAVPTFVLDTRHRVIIWNKACEELTGIKATEILGTADSWKAFYGKERPVLADIVIDGNDKDLPFYYDSCSKSPFTPDGLQAEGWRRTANGREIYAFFDTAPVPQCREGDHRGYSDHADITGAEAGRESWRSRSHPFHSAGNSIDGILVVDGKHHQILQPAVCRFVGISRRIGGSSR